MIQQTDIFTIFAFIFGSCVGSFLNVVIYRLPEGISIVTPGSRCPKCEQAIPLYLNIPVFSYLMLAGKCRYCKTRIPMRYPAVELLTGIIFLLIFLRFGVYPETLFWMFFSAVLIAVSFIDLDHQIIPDVISIPGIFVFAFSWVIVPEMTFLGAVYGILTGGGILYAVALGYYFLRGEQGMGGGDIKLLAMIGAATGIKGVVFTLFSGSLFGTLGGLLAVILGKKTGARTRIPFGPFLSAGAIAYVLWGDALIRWYFNLLTRS